MLQHYHKYYKIIYYVKHGKLCYMKYISILTVCLSFDSMNDYCQICQPTAEINLKSARNTTLRNSLPDSVLTSKTLISFRL